MTNAMLFPRGDALRQMAREAEVYSARLVWGLALAVLARRVHLRAAELLRISQHKDLAIGLAHMEGGVSLSILASLRGCEDSTIVRAVRRCMDLTDDFVWQEIYEDCASEMEDLKRLAKLHEFAAP